jgi:cytochrome c oxidase assembly factor CtaG
VRHALVFLGTWTFEWIPAALLIASSLLYLAGVRILARRQQSWSAWRTTSFQAGLALIWFVTLGPIGAYDDVFFWSHMVQHIVLMMVSAPLLLLGSPVLLLLRVSPRRIRHDYLVPVLRSRVVVGLSDPRLGWLLYGGVLIGTHFSPFYDYALYHPSVHNYVEHPLFLGVALIYYYPLIGHNSVPRYIKPGIRFVSLSLMMIPGAILGLTIYSSNYILFPFYEHVARPFPPFSTLVDQQLGGALMWAGGMIIESIWITLSVLDWLRSEEQNAHRVDVQTLAMPTQPAS